MNLHEPASRVGVSKTVGEAAPADYDGLLIPGGFINPDLLRQWAEARQFVRQFAAADKPMPRPSIRTALGLGAVALVAAAARWRPAAAVLRQDDAAPASRHLSRR